jgi:hypothetical protein
VIAIHAGGVLEQDGLAWLQLRGFSVPENLPRAAVVGTARIEAVIEEPVDDPWWEGPVGWLLAEVKPLPEPISCPGGQGLWKLPAEIAQLINNK